MCAGLLAAFLGGSDPSPAAPASLPPWLSAPASSAVPFRAADAPFTEDDQYWSDAFALPEPDGWPSSAVVYNGAFVIGGRFTQVDGVPVNYIARWDGERWSALGGGLDGEVLCLAVYRGELIASGRFGNAGDLAVNGIARWNGARWAPLGNGLRWSSTLDSGIGANDLAVVGDALYATGLFDWAGDVEAPHVARWNGTTWSALGSGLDGEGQSLVGIDGMLYAGGSFASAGGHPASGIASWNGYDWSPVGDGFSYLGHPPIVLDLAAYQGMLVATGFFDRAGSTILQNLAAWDGSQWSALGGLRPDGYPNGGFALAVHGNSLLVGSSGLLEWDGTRWVPESPLPYGWVRCLLDTPAGLVVGGAFTAYTSTGRIAAVNIGVHYAGEWDRLVSWTDRMNGISAPTAADVTALASYRGHLVAAGYFDHAGSADGWIPVSYFAEWNGEKWSTIGTGFYSGVASSFLASGSKLYAAGTYWGRTGMSPMTMFDGVDWSTLDTLTMSGRSVLEYRGDLFVAGNAFGPNWPQAGGVYRWSGVHWVAVGLTHSSDDFGGVSSMVEHEGRLVVAGRFDRIGGVPAKGIAAWDGSTWSAMDQGIVADYFFALGACNGELLVSSPEMVAQGRLTNVARWDGSGWQSVPSDRVRPIGFLCVDRQLYAGGEIQDANLVRRGIVRWDGQGWSPLGSGTDGQVHSLVVHDGQLYVGGTFNRAGAHQSIGIARWDLRSQNRTRSMLESSACTPNPFQTSTSFAFRLAAPTRTRVTVLDIRGARVATLEDSQRPAGTHVLTWDGHDSDGSVAPPGMYFFRIDLGGSIQTRRAIRLR